MKFSNLLAPALASALLIAAPVQAAVDWAAVGAALGKTGAVQPGGVYRVGLPRSDLHVTLDGVTLKPALALGSWLAFRETDGRGEVMGDLVLTQEEVNPVLSALEANGVDVTAVHNHLLRATPATLYVHVDGHGDPVKLAAALRQVLSRTRTPMGAPPPSAAAPLALDTALLDRTLAAKGKASGGVYQFSIPRAEPPTEGGMPIPPSMGSAIGVNFQPLGGGRAATTGDFVLTAGEVNPVIRAMRAGGIEVTALHNHMLDDEPRLFFMHFWGQGDAVRLATTLRAALDQVRRARD